MPNVVNGITIVEVRRSRGHVSSAKPTARREYMAWGSNNGDTIEDAVDDVRPLTVNGLVIESVSADPREEDETVWDVVYNYATIGGGETPATKAEEISFELGSMTVNITHNPFGLAATQKYAPKDQTAPDFKGGIGWDGEQFTGIDRMFETFSFSITKQVPKATVEAAQYIRQLRDCAFATNSAPFRGFAAGEVMFVGASGTKRSETDYSVTFKFMAGKNLGSFQVGDIVVSSGPGGGPAKRAWDYLWVLYDEAEDTAADFTVKRPKAAYVEALYGSANFPSLLGVTA